jgi:leucyl-tRNA synthetase
MQKYNPQKIEAKWQKYWEAHETFAANNADKRPKKYILDMFPYPSGVGLHVGHPEGYTATDILSRFSRMNGFNVLHPMGWDAFGLPAENYAIKEGVHPQKTTQKNIKRFTEQIKAIGLSYDWSREINTSDPDYYKWTQWLFLQLYKKGLAYKKEASVNWCPKDNTVLANEQVVDGKCERCGTTVIQKNLSQWFFKITDYAEELLLDLDKLDWPEPIKLMQKNWIGKSQGAEIDFMLARPPVKRFVILHGKRSSPPSSPLSGFIPWLAKRLEEKGFEVQVPILPNPNEPNDIEQVEFVKNHCTLDEQSVVIGHSFGGVVALRLLEQGIKVNRAILVATPYSGTFLDGKERPTVAAAVKKGFDFKKIKEQAKEFYLLYDTGDYVVPISDGEAYAEKLNVNINKVKGQKPHLTGVEEPEVLNACLPFIKVFTTRPDTIFGATYMVLAPEHITVKNLESRIQNLEEVQKYIEATKKKSELQRTQLEKEKTGVELKGIKAINPVTKQEIPVWIADYVITGYGTGAIMAVPAHDERDWEFAKKFGLPIKQVVAPMLVSRDGFLKFHENEPYIERNVIRAVVKHWEKDEYLILDWKRDSNKSTFISGGIDDGESPEQTVLREIKEETGYTDVVVKQQLGTVKAKFYAPNKKQNRCDTQTGFYVELKSDRQIGVAEDEQQIHIFRWLAKDKVQEAIGWGLVDPIFWRQLQGQESAGVEYGVLINSGDFTGLESEQAMKKIGSRFGKLTTKYKLRDWLVSRQRYWGAPIPIVYCEKCGEQPVLEKDLPVKLPTDVDFVPTGESPLKRSKKFSKVICPKCKGKAERDYDTMDTFVDSSWYFLRFVDSKNKKEFANKKKIKEWLPVNTYVGGAEHAVLHLLYSRFFTKALRDFGLLNFDEPFLKLRNQGLILGPDGEKMSKSRGNVINPDDVIKEFGADSLRMYEMFMGPLEDAKPWQTQGIVGVKRFLDRVWNWISERSVPIHGQLKEADKSASARLPSRDGSARYTDSEKVTRALNKLIKKISEDIENFHFNTSVSAFMEFHNEVKDAPASVESVKIFLKLLYPFAPHITEELHQLIGGKKSLQLETWPTFDPKKIIDDTVEIVVQVNGKVKGKVTVPSGSDENTVKELGMNLTAVKILLEGHMVKRTIFVKDRLINLVI